MKYVLDIEKGRELISISSNTVNFNISGHMEFDSREELNAFLKQWEHHFFRLHTLEIAEVREKKT